MCRNYVPLPKTFIQERYVKKRKLTTDECYDYSQFSEESLEWNFVPQCHGRILLSLWNHEFKDRTQNPNDIETTHRKCLQYLSVVMEQSRVRDSHIHSSILDTGQIGITM